MSDVFFCTAGVVGWLVTLGILGVATIILISQKYMRKNRRIRRRKLAPSPGVGGSWDGGDAARDDATIPARRIDRPVTIHSKFDSPVILKVWLFYPHEQVPQSISWPIDFTFCLRPKTVAGLELLNRGADQPGGA